MDDGGKIYVAYPKYEDRTCGVTDTGNQSSIDLLTSPKVDYSDNTKMKNCSFERMLFFSTSSQDTISCLMFSIKRHFSFVIQVSY